MKSKAEKLKRLVKVQRHMERMAELELAETSRTRQEISLRQDHAIEAISSMEPIHAGLKSQYALQYERLTTRDAQLSRLQEVQQNQVLREKAKADRLDEHYVGARDDEDREQQETALFDMLEVRLATPASSKLDKA